MRVKEAKDVYQGRSKRKTITMGKEWEVYAYSTASTIIIGPVNVNILLQRRAQKVPYVPRHKHIGLDLASFHGVFFEFANDIFVHRSANARDCVNQKYLATGKDLSD